MSGPGGSVTRRDQRRLTRQEQYQQRQRERQRERQRAIQRKRLTRGALIGGAVLVIIILAIIISQLVMHAGSQSTGGAPSLTAKPATGQAVDGLTCLPQQGGAMHTHQYLELYINGQRVNANPGIGLVDSANCLYPLHVHDKEANIIHVESSVQGTFTLGQFFDIWGVNLSSAQVGSYKVDSSHKLVIEIFDANGKMTTYTGNPHDLALQERQTISVLYNSPNVKPVPYDGWDSFEG
ncbi:MAG TPA: hypothetical protein VFQ25_16730 [Ktedonobacterales bacterium]|nr:hypothetical protein [Ktedonobacterales bacterium]